MKFLKYLLSEAAKLNMDDEMNPDVVTAHDVNTYVRMVRDELKGKKPTRANVTAAINNMIEDDPKFGSNQSAYNQLVKQVVPKLVEGIDGNLSNDQNTRLSVLQSKEFDKTITPDEQQELDRLESLWYGNTDTSQIQRLMAKSRSGTLTASEQRTLDSYKQDPTVNFDFDQYNMMDPHARSSRFQFESVDSLLEVSTKLLKQYRKYAEQDRNHNYTNAQYHKAKADKHKRDMDDENERDNRDAAAKHGDSRINSLEKSLEYGNKGDKRDAGIEKANERLKKRGVDESYQQIRQVLSEISKELAHRYSTTKDAHVGNVSEGWDDDDEDPDVKIANNEARRRGVKLLSPRAEAALERKLKRADAKDSQSKPQDDKE